MKINTKFYGELEINEEEIIQFPQGLPGFEEEKRFVYLQSEENFFGSLQAVDLETLGFVVISPFIICPDYHFDLEDQIVNELGLEKDRKSTRLNSSHVRISYAVFCLKKKKKKKLR